MQITYRVRWFYILIFSFIVTRGSSNLSLSDFNIIDEAQLINDELVNAVIREYFSNDKCVVFVTGSDDLVEPVDSISPLSYILISTDEVCHTTLVDQLVFAIDWFCYSYIIKTTDPKSVLKAWGEAQLAYEVRTTQRISPKIFAVISDSDAVRMPDEIADEFLSLPEAELSSNTVVALLHHNASDWPVSIYTNNFYERVGNQGREPKIFLDRWSRQEGFEHGTDLYEDKIRDMRGKELIVAVVSTPPYCQLEPFIGQEVQMIKTFCEFHNCTAKGISDDFLHGDIFENGTGIGMLGMIYEGKADFGVSGAYLWISYYRHVDYSRTYLHSGLTLLVPKAELIGGWLVPFLPFTPAMWIAYFLSVGATGISMFLITKATIKYTRFAESVQQSGMFLTPMDTVFRSIGLSVLQQPSTPLVPHTPIRHLFTSFEVLYLILSTIYAAELASFLTAPQYTKPIDTIYEFADSGIIWIAESAAFVYSLLGADSPVISTIANNFRMCYVSKDVPAATRSNTPAVGLGSLKSSLGYPPQVIPSEKIDELAVTGKYGLYLERLAGGHFTNPGYSLTEEVITKSHIMAQYLYASPTTTVLRKGIYEPTPLRPIPVDSASKNTKASPYLHHYNKVVGRLVENGLLLQWEAEGSRLYLSSRVQTVLNDAAKINGEDVARPLTTNDFVGMFLLYVAGILIGTAVFIGEMITARVTKKQHLNSE